MHECKKNDQHCKSTQTDSFRSMSPAHRQLLPLVVVPNDRYRKYDRFARRYRSHQQIPESNSSEAKGSPYMARAIRGNQQSTEVNFNRSISAKERTLRAPIKPNPVYTPSDGSDETSYAQDSSTTV